VQSETIANVVETDGVSELRVEKTNHVTPWGEASRLLVDFVLGGETTDEMSWNELAELRENADL
jgi:hypothetical protein